MNRPVERTGDMRVDTGERAVRLSASLLCSRLSHLCWMLVPPPPPQSSLFFNRFSGRHSKLIPRSFSNIWTCISHAGDPYSLSPMNSRPEMVRHPIVNFPKLIVMSNLIIILIFVLILITWRWAVIRFARQVRKAGSLASGGKIFFRFDFCNTFSYHFVKIIKYAWNCEIWSKLWNLVEIL